MPQPVFVFKVALAGRKSTWRRIGVRGGQTLDDLHEMIFEAFDRDDEHLYSFYFPKPGAKGRNRLQDAKEYTSPLVAEQESVWSESLLNAAKAEIGSLGLEPGQAFLYLFDFGDEWWHDVTVEKIDAPAEKGQYPHILDSRGQSPPQYPDDDDMDEE